ncbi:MAG: hypothetical protein OEW19_00610 [Acidobacteriota bacterium]|nr:hypothetical protein [Acidobacteriota bacterium]
MSRHMWAVLFLAALLAPRVAHAQSLGLFSWQLAPFCNVMTVEVVQVDGLYRLQGADDQCAGGPLATAVGLGYPNRDGTIGLGLLIVTAPGGVPVHLSASLRPSDLSGHWRDSAGNRGEMLPPWARRSGGQPRPEPVFGATLVQPENGPDRGFNVVVSTDTGDIGGDAAALYGQFGAGSGFDQPGNAGLRGDSDADIGALGTSRSGSGVRGLTDGGVGVEGYAQDGTAVRAVHERGGTALEIVNGSFKVSGDLRPAFIHTTGTPGPSADSSCIDHPLTNDRPDAIVLITHRFGGSGVNVPAVGIYYDGGWRQWCIFTEGGSPMPEGVPFNVLVISQ